MTLRNRLHPALLAIAGLSLACTLTFSPGLLQSLRLFFEIAATLPAGEATLIQSLVSSERITLKKKLVSVSGALEPGSGGRFPSRLELVAESVELETGKKLYTFKLAVVVRADGTFAAVKKYKRNLPAGTMTTITVEPVGRSLERGTRVALCVDVVKRKSDLDASPCPTASDTGPTSLTAIQAQIFTPSCAKVGCHDSGTASAGLILAAGASYDQLVGAPSNQVPFRLRVEPGNSENSYLMMKLRGSAGIDGVRMPLDGPPFLSTAQLAGITAWIDSGAADD